jgi:5-methylcytosine-specific restriction protein A
MPEKAKKLCAMGGCTRIIPGDQRHCAEHAEAYRIRRRGQPSTTDPFLSSSAWRKLRKAKLLANPLCEPCERTGRVTAAAEVHHKLARREHPALALDWDNLECCCRNCHRAATLREMRERKQGPGGG